ECRWFLGGCSGGQTCCEHLVCHRKHQWCVWDWSF
uniref:Mu-theraphotoxin-Df1a n=1 Tax=Davus fasciatus TaxID=2024242 RepID=TXDF1_DAFVA|nr:RecName: Full=Mu-theraphotoxin-Df1a; Short=Mu-TRTX-Df1a [Davus fasciatus]